MVFNPEIHHRRSIRLKGYDYTRAGAYFVTICTHNRRRLFGEVVDGEMRLNACGEIVRNEWFKTAVMRPYVRLDEHEFVVMPNHVHGIIWITDDDVDVGARQRRSPTMRRRAPTMRRHTPTVGRRAPTMRRRTPTVGRRAPTMRRRTPTVRRRAPTREQFGKPVVGSVPTIVRAFKSAVTKCINGVRGTAGVNFH